jgi:putative component of membrane protein insertase Oxa1/YidC/SpoIIIJ protein YidD
VTCDASSCAAINTVAPLSCSMYSTSAVRFIGLTGTTAASARRIA